MYCSQCGTRLTDGGAKAAEAETSSEEAAAGYSGPADVIHSSSDSFAIPIDSQDRSRREREGGAARRIWLVPAALAVVVAGSLYAYYDYETRINDRVIGLQQQAREAALAGKHDQALALLADASSKRPGFAPLKADSAIVRRAANIEALLASSGEQMTSGDLIEAERLLVQVKEDLKDNVEPIYDSAKAKYDERNKSLTLMKLKQELETAATVDELAAKLNVATELEGEEAAALQERIETQIVELSTDEAERLLDKKSYSGALAAANKALLYVKNDERLLSLKQKIEQAKASYEQAEQRRIEQAMQKAAEEDLKNQTAAVEVVSIESTIDEFGDLNVHGELKNAATRPIYSVVVSFTVYDAQGNELGSGTAEAAPSYIEPGESMSFFGTVYGIYDENSTVVVDHATWYLD